MTNGNGCGPTDVGIWYCTYYGGDWDNVGGMGYKPTLYRPLCSGAPGDFRTYRSGDTGVIDFHLRQIADAKIDFVLFEVTPGGLGGYRPSMKQFVDNARVAARRVGAWNREHSWKIRYAVAAGAHRDVYGTDPIGLCMEREAREVYESFYLNPEYGGPESYYQLDGKPLLVYWGDPMVTPQDWLEEMVQGWDTYAGDTESGSRFSRRYAGNVRSGTYGWNIFQSGTVVHPEVEVVSPGWGHYSRANPPYVSRRRGDFYRACWETVLKNPRPEIVMVVAFNDYAENTAVWTADTSRLTDADTWQDHDGRLHPSMYWDMTVDYIKALRSGIVTA